MKSKESKLAPNQYQVSLSVGTDIYTASAVDPVEAILEIKPKKITSKCLFTMKYGDKTSCIIKHPARVRFILTHKLAAVLLSRYLVGRLI